MIKLMDEQTTYLYACIKLRTDTDIKVGLCDQTLLNTGKSSSSLSESYVLSRLNPGRLGPSNERRGIPFLPRASTLTPPASAAPAVLRLDPTYSRSFFKYLCSLRIPTRMIRMTRTTTNMATKMPILNVARFVTISLGPLSW